MNPSLILNLQAAPPVTETVAGWQVESYALSGTARAPGAIDEFARRAAKIED